MPQLRQLHGLQLRALPGAQNGSLLLQAAGGEQEEQRDEREARSGHQQRPGAAPEGCRARRRSPAPARRRWSRPECEPRRRGCSAEAGTFRGPAASVPRAPPGPGAPGGPGPRGQHSPRSSRRSPPPSTRSRSTSTGPSRPAREASAARAETRPRAAARCCFPPASSPWIVAPRADPPRRCGPGRCGCRRRPLVRAGARGARGGERGPARARPRSPAPATPRPGCTCSSLRALCRATGGNPARRRRGPTPPPVPRRRPRSEPCAPRRHASRGRRPAAPPRVLREIGRSAPLPPRPGCDRPRVIPGERSRGGSHSDHCSAAAPRARTRTEVS